MAQPGPPVGPPVGQKLYFAYGSNLNLPQMAQRSPGSVFVGLATLHGYRWQINERGVANVVPVADGDESGGGTSTVQGLLYLVTPQDEASLDRYEGTSRGLYQKHMLPVQLLQHPRYAGRFTEEVSQDLAQRLGGRGRLSSEDSSFSHFPNIPSADQPMPMAMMTEELALVYVSEHHTKDGRIRDEYVGRMQIAVQYALALGISQAFVDSVIAPHLNGRHGEAEDDPEGERRGSSRQKGAAAAASDCGTADCTHGSERLCRLRLENRQPHEATGIRFDASLLALLAQRMAEAERNEVAEAEARAEAKAGHGRSTGSRTARDGPVYVVVLQAPLVGTEASYSIEAVTQSLALANELAMKSFRDACSEADWEHGNAGDNRSRSSGRSSKNAVIGPAVVAQHQLSGRPGTFGCVLDDNRCLLLVCTLPDGGQVRAWVTVQELLE